MSQECCETYQHGLFCNTVASQQFTNKVYKTRTVHVHWETVSSILCLYFSCFWRSNFLCSFRWDVNPGNGTFSTIFNASKGRGIKCKIILLSNTLSPILQFDFQHFPSFYFLKDKPLISQFLAAGPHIPSEFAQSHSIWNIHNCQKAGIIISSDWNIFKVFLIKRHILS